MAIEAKLMDTNNKLAHCKSKSTTIEFKLEISKDLKYKLVNTNQKFLATNKKSASTSAKLIAINNKSPCYKEKSNH